MGRMDILRSPVIPQDGFVHGFPTRHGGVSTGKRASLNLGYRWGDEPEHVAENRRRVAAAAVGAMGARFGSGARDGRVALGPSIGPCCFEVGPEVVEAFRGAFGDLPGMVVAGPKKDHVDLRVATRALLERAGVWAEHID